MVMEGMVKKRKHETKTTPSPLTMHNRDSSQVLSNFKPKIRIIHIFAPEIIKTDVENFRELVQRLTGKPNTEDKKPTKKRSRNMSKNLQDSSADYWNKPETRMMEPQYDQYQSPWNSSEESVKHEELDIMWGGENNSSGFYNGFGDLDGLIHGLSDFPLLPFNSSSQSPINAFGAY